MGWKSTASGIVLDKIYHFDIMVNSFTPRRQPGTNIHVFELCSCMTEFISVCEGLLMLSLLCSPHIVSREAFMNFK